MLTRCDWFLSRRKSASRNAFDLLSSSMEITSFIWAHGQTFTHNFTLAITAMQHVIKHYKMLPSASIFLEPSVGLRREALVNSQSQVLNSKSIVKTGKDTVCFYFWRWFLLKFVLLVTFYYGNFPRSPQFLCCRPQIASVN